MSSYQRISDGSVTTVDDPERGIWYSAGRCGYWTDNWEKLATHGKHGIPCCPHCGAVGMQANAKDWFACAERFQNEGNPRYLEFLDHSKEQCTGRRGKAFLERYADFVK